jgi:ABC-type lipoprotein release transport system permease subunit
MLNRIVKTVKGTKCRTNSGGGKAIEIVGVSANTSFARSVGEISPLDPLALAAMTGTLTITAALAIYFPARRATKVDSLIAVRRE